MPKKGLEKELGDELLNAVVQAEARDEKMNRATGYKKPEYLDAVQWRVEKAIIRDFNESNRNKKKSEFLSYGSVIDALRYISEGLKLEKDKHVNFEWEKWISERQVEEISKRLMDVVLRAIKEYEIPESNKEIPEVLMRIRVRYRNYCEYRDRGRWGDRSQKVLAEARVPYRVGWSPWFKGLNERFMKNVANCLDIKTYAEREIEGVRELFGRIPKNIRDTVVRYEDGKPVTVNGRKVTVGDGLETLRWNECVMGIKEDGRTVYTIEDIVEKARKQSRLAFNCVEAFKDAKRKNFVRFREENKKEKRMYDAVAEALKDVKLDEASSDTSQGLLISPF